MRRRLVAASLVGLCSASLALAQSQAPQDEAYDLATIEADHDICGFPLSDEQQDVIAQRREALVTRGDLNEEELASVRGQITAAAQRQKDEGLCRANGPEAQAYKRRLTNLGLL